MLVLNPPWLGNRRRIIEGILNYARQHARWDFAALFQPTYGPEVIERYPEADGIVFEPRRALNEAVLASGKPAVALHAGGGARFSRVEPDHRAVTEMTLDDLQQRGLRHFALCSVERHRDTPRSVYFRQTCRERGLTWQERLVDLPTGAPTHRRALEQAWTEWLAELPTPVGLFCPWADHGQDILSAARLAGIDVPERMAVLPAGINDLQCEMCTPPLSTIDAGSHERGYAIGRLLEQHMRTPDLPPQHLTVPPRGVVTRRSMEMLAIDDPILADAVRHVRRHARESTTVNELVEPIPMARRTLEAGFKRVFGRTLGEEMIRLKIARAQQLLTESAMSMPEITARCGFSYASHFSRVFKQRVGMTPSAYRHRFP